MAFGSAVRDIDLGSVLVIGGCGFLGHHIVDLLLSSPYLASVSVLDICTTRNRRPTLDGVMYFEGDISSPRSTIKHVTDSRVNHTSQERVEGLTPFFYKVRPDVVIHTASPIALLRGSKKALYSKVNVQGTKHVIEACQKTGVKALVYTSSASVVSDNTARSSSVNADEEWPVQPFETQSEYYSWTKAEAESAVVAANRSIYYPHLLTTCIRPAGIFGPGDMQILPRILAMHRAKLTRWQLGDNTNLCDFTHVKNVAHAHLLAARALFVTYSLNVAVLSCKKVDGEVFFITDDSPILFWNFVRAVWKAAGNEEGTKHIRVLPKTAGLALGALLELIARLSGKTPKLTTTQVKYTCATQYYNINKAKIRLGYKPIVGLQEGIETSVGWFLERERE